MIILSPGEGTYKKGERTPLIAIPIEAKGEKQELEDFQWWSESKDFHGWLEENPREWTAESLNYLSDNYINENKISNLLNHTFLNEAEEKEEASEELVRNGIKFGYAYNRLIKAGDMETTFVPSKMDDEPIALFMNLVAEEDNPDGMVESLQAYRAKIIGAGNKAFSLINIDYALPYSEEIKNDETFTEVIDDILKKSLLFGAAIAVSLTIFVLGKFVAKVVLGRFVFARVVKNFANGKNISSRAIKASNKLKRARRMARTTKHIKTGFGTVLGIASLKSTRAGIGTTIRNARIKNIKPVGLLRAFMRGSGLDNLFPKFMGKTGIRLGAKGASRAIPVIGEILLLADAVYSLWSWNRSSQAPKYSEVKSFAKKEFNPAKIKVGVPITICWSQPSGSWLNWVTSNETRTTMELIKIGEYEKRSIFILARANSKELQKSLGENALVMLAFENSRIVKRGWIDNMDLDHELIKIEGEEGLLGPFIYQGHTDWDRFKNEFDEAPDYLIGRLKEAPDEFTFHFEDADSDVINLTGKILDTNRINKLKEKEILEIFGFGDNNDLNESEIFEYGLNLKIKKTINEFLNEAESNEGDTLTLTPENQTNPVWVSIYEMTDAFYANPEIEAKKEIPNVGYYLVYNESLNVDDGEPVLVFSDMDIEFTNAKKGLYKYKEEEEDKEEDKEEEGEDKKDDKDKEESDKNSERDLLTTPSDVSYKERKNSTVIKDRIKKDGINILNEFLTKEDIKTLQIDGWKNITKINVKKRGGVTSKITFHNMKAAFSDRKREYIKEDGEAYEIAKKLVTKVKDEIKYI